MRILVNYQNSEAKFLPLLKYYIAKQGLTAVSTSLSLSLGELVSKAQNSNCGAILLANGDTLKDCVPGARPTLDMYRGSILRTPVPIVICNSIAHAHTVNHGSKLLEWDLAKIKVAGGKHVDFEFEVLENEFEMEAAFKHMEASALLAFDVETITVKEDKESLDAPETVITCCSWTAVSHDLKLKTFVLPMIDFNVDHWVTDAQYAVAIRFMQRTNALTVAKAMHNGMYDCMHAIRYGAYPMNWVLDTMGMAHSQYSELPKTLDFTASLHIPDYIQWKGESVEAHNQKDIYRYWQYNGLDTHYTARLAIHYLWHMPAYARTNYSMLFPLVYPALYCEFEGMLLDNKEREKLLAEYNISMETELTKLRVMVADPNFNPSSPKQVATYIYDVFGAVDPHIGKKKVDNHTIKKSRGTDEKNLKIIGAQHPILTRITDAVTKYREDRKAIGTYFTFLQSNNRLLYSLNPFGTDTGRMSCQSSSLWCGTQMQNIPAYAKSMMIADEGFTIYEYDKSQSEARCTAYLAQDLVLIAALEGQLDFYTSLGKKFFNIEYEDVTKEFRNKVLKKICHGTNYVMGAQTFIDNVGTAVLLQAALDLGVSVTMARIVAPDQISLKQFANDLLEVYHKPFNRIRPWYGEVKVEVAGSHMLKSPLGYTRYFFGDIIKNHNVLRSAIAHGPQNLSVGILNQGLWKAWKLVIKYPSDFRLKAQIHDSVLAQIRDGREDIVKEFGEAMEASTIIHGREMIIPNDCTSGKVWTKG